jgi:hypothetical protein
LDDTQLKVSQQEVEQEVTMIQGYISYCEDLTADIRDDHREKVDIKQRTFAEEVEKAWDAFEKEFRRQYDSTVSTP